MLKAYRVHRKDCAKGASKWDRKVENCTCPVYMGGECGGRFFKTHNLHTLNWAQAQKFIADANLRGSREAPEAEKPHKDQMPVETAIDKFLADIRDRLRKPTVKKYLVLLKRERVAGKFHPDRHSPTLMEWLGPKGLSTLADRDVDLMREFRQTWKDGAYSCEKKLERLRSFFDFCIEAGWIEKNPANGVKAPEPEEETVELAWQQGRSTLEVGGATRG